MTLKTALRIGCVFVFELLFVDVPVNAEPPNVVIILCDDLGYGDLSCQGHPVIRTPNIDRLARDGQRWTTFYASAPLCNTSRVAMLTGRLPIRIHKSGRNRWQTMPKSEVTIAELLKQKDYATGYVGKWGVSNFEATGAHPNDQGFDYYFGLVGSNDTSVRENFRRTYEGVRNSTSEDFLISLYRQREAIESPADQTTLTKRYTEESVRWVERQTETGKPFLLFLSHTMPHVPIFCSPEFRGHSTAGLYGDVIEEIDWSVGRIIGVLKERNVADNTLVFFSSDNGPWLTYYDLGGSSGPLRDGKLTSWEGGFRVPGVFWWPGTIEPAVIDDIGANVDLIATLATLTGTKLEPGRIFDSLDLSPVLLAGKPSPRTEWFYYGQPGNLWAARTGHYKLAYESWESLGKEKERGWRGYDNHQQHKPPLLFNLSTDIGERLDIAAEKPDVVASIQAAVRRHRESLGGGAQR